MKKILLTSLGLAFLACAASTNQQKEDNKPEKTRILTEETKKYWYNGGAEITSYKLTQARYGELREGEAVMIFVTEPFSPSANTKADQASKENVHVLKLNFTKRFNTGIYPYSMMNSTFYPMTVGNHSLKVSTSAQEWCGHVYMELRNKKKFEIENHSYFEGESFKREIDKVELEDDIWSKIRLNPELIKNGETKMIPSFFYLRLMHIDTKAFKCEISLAENTKDQTKMLTLFYPELKRSLQIQFESTFPHHLIGWSEKYTDGYGPNKKELVTTGEKIKTIRSAYWQLNSNSDEYLREELGLKY